MLALTNSDFTCVNPNTGAAPIFRTKRDAELTTRIYTNHPVLVNRSTGTEKRVWPVRYVTMFHMTNDSDKFLTRAELEKQGWRLAPLNRWVKGKAEAVPLYEGKMVQMYDHRAADVVVERRTCIGRRSKKPSRLARKPHRIATLLLSFGQCFRCRRNMAGRVVAFVQVDYRTDEHANNEFRVSFPKVASVTAWQSCYPRVASLEVTLFFRYCSLTCQFTPSTCT